MDTLSASSAVTLVRRNLDELDTNASAMYTDEASDNTSLDNTIKRLLPDAINSVHKAAPISLLEGEDVKAVADAGIPFQDDKKVLGITLGITNLLRLVAYKSSDSDIVITDIIPEASPEGRKQFNKHIRGRYDRPRLVMLQGNTLTPVFRYYSLKEDFDPENDEPEDFIETFLVVKRQDYIASDQATYNISSLLRQNIIDYLTALTLEAFADQRAQIYYTKALAF